MSPFSNGWTEADIEAALERGTPEELLYIPIAIGMNAPYCERRWVEDICLKLCTHPHFNVRGNAILGLGHIARTCRELDLERALPAISKALHDEHEYVRGQANSASSDLELYLGVIVPGYDGEQTNALLAAIERLKKDRGI